MKETWMIIGATSVIAEAFALEMAALKHDVILVGRQEAALNAIASNLTLRHGIDSTIIICDMAKKINPILTVLENTDSTIHLFIACSAMQQNHELNDALIKDMITVNITHTILLIEHYLKKQQTTHQFCFLSSVASMRGRSKNSIYGATKAAIEVYLEGLQHQAIPNTFITIMRLGFIDTKHTFGLPGVFYAAPPSACAKACVKAINKHKRLVTYPFIWRPIMFVIRQLPFFLFRKIN